MFYKLLLIWAAIIDTCTPLLGEDCKTVWGGKGRCIQREKCLPESHHQQEIKYFDSCANFLNESVCCPLMETIVTPISKHLHDCSTFYTTSNSIRNETVLAAIVGGEPSPITEFPHMAALGYENGNDIQWRCAGSLISDSFILTAAHCVFNDRSYGKLKIIRLGDYNLQSGMDDAAVQDFAVARIFTHPEYAPPVLYNDIALILLDHSVKITDYVKPACLQPSPYIHPKLNLIATGWGRNQSSGFESGYLQKVSLESFSNFVCRHEYGFTFSRQLPNGIGDERQLCAGSSSEKRDTCQGDSGGPLHIVSRQNPKIYFIVGITSFGKGCGLNIPGVYTKVSYFIPWIQQIIH